GAARESQRSVTLGDRSSVVAVAEVTPELADVLQLAPSDGVTISHRVWQIEFSLDTEVRGKPIRIDGVEAHVAGVAPDWLQGLYLGRAVDIWMPLSEASLQAVDRSSRSFWAFGRLRRGV